MKAAPAPSFPAEPAEPTARTGPSWVLMGVIGLLAVTFYLAAGYVDDHSGNFHPLVYEPFHTTNELADFLPKGEGELLIAKGKIVYTRICAPCHMESGTGDPTRFIPPLAGSEWVLAAGPNRIARIVLNGLNGPINVKGQNYSGTAMLAWKDTLNDDDIAAALTYVRSSWGNKAAPITTEQVKKIRAATADRTDNWAPEDLLKLPEAD